MTISVKSLDAEMRDQLGVPGVQMAVTVKVSTGLYTVETSPPIQPRMLLVLRDSLAGVWWPHLAGEVTLTYLPDKVMLSPTTVPQQVVGQITEALQPHVETMLGELEELLDHLTPIDELRTVTVGQMCSSLHQHLKNEAAKPQLVSWHPRFLPPDRSGLAQVALKEALANAPAQVRDLYHASQELDRQLRGRSFGQLEIEMVGSIHPVFGDLLEQITAVAIQHIVRDERGNVMAQVQAEIMSRFKGA